MKSSNHLISIIIPNFNRMGYLQQALDAIISQTYSNWEAIVIDDGSTDGSKKNLSQYVKEDKRMQWIDRNRKPKGAATCRNIGIEHAKGDFIIFLDSDDLLAPHCLERRLQVMQDQPHLDFAVFKMQFFKAKPGDDNRIWNHKTKTSILQRFLNLDSVWQTSGPIWKTSALKTLRGFNEKLQCWQDFDIHLKALFANLSYAIRYDLPVDCYYRKNAMQTISQTNMNALPKLKSKIALYNWAKPIAQKHRVSIKAMLHHILISALNGHQIDVFNALCRAEKDKLDPDVMFKMKFLKWIKVCRLDRINFIQQKIDNLKESLIIETSIGKYQEEYQIKL